jgi:hypothetical protein
MRNYLSFGGGVNSVAMMLYLLDEGWDFEAVFVNHGTDWPETYEYLDMFQEWLDKKGVKPVIVLRPEVQGSDNLYDHCLAKKIVPSFMSRWCTDKFKVRVLQKYYQKPCFQCIGIDAGEIKRAKISTDKEVEKRYPLIEADIDRTGCVNLIKKHGLPVPMKSGCYICPFQRKSQWVELRYKHPCLFKRAVDLEKIIIQHRIDRGLDPLFLCMSPKASLEAIVNETQTKLFERDEYPPCHCML